MARERLMRQQRERLQEWRKKNKAPKTPATKKGVTRDTSKDQSRKKIARLTGGSTPATSDAATKRLNQFLKAKPPKVAPQTPKPAETKPAVTKPKTGKAVLELGGGNVRKGTLPKKPKGQKPSTSSNFMSSSSTYTGTNLEKPKPKKQSPRAGSRAAAKPRTKTKPKVTGSNRYQRRRRGR